MQQTASAEQPRRATSRARRAGAPVGGLGVLILAAGGFGTAILAALVLWGAGGAAGSNAAALSPVPSAEIEAASTSLYSDQAVSMIEDARTCKAPLAQLWLQKWGDSALGDTVRIRSGTYLSPWFKIVGEARRIAIPYPAPYQTGHGTIEVLGEGRRYTVALVPAHGIPELEGVERINVKWQPSSPC